MTIRFRADMHPLQQALLRAEANPITLPEHEDRPFPAPKYARFISFIGHLHFIRGGKEMYLSCRTIAKVLGTTRSMVSIWRRDAENEGFLEKTAEHQFSKTGKSKATEYKLKGWAAEWFKAFVEKRN